MNEPVTNVRILVVPGFVADTYSEIERSYVELCANPGVGVEYLWLVPDMSSKYLTFSRPENRKALAEPAYVSFLKENEIPYIVGNISKYNFLSNYFLLSKIFQLHQIDAVYTHFGYERFWAALFGKLLRKRVIWNEHWYSLGMRHRYLKQFFYRMFIDGFISVSKFVANTLPSTGKVCTIPNSINCDIRPLNNKERLELRQRHGISADKTVVLMVAAFTPQKRHMLALEVCKRVLKERRDVMFIFLGDGTTRPAFLEEAAHQGLIEHIIAPGYVYNVDDFYSASDVSMLTSRHEGFGYAVLEAMKHSLPVLVFDSGALPELVRDGATGFVVDDGDIASFTRRLVHLLDSKSAQLALGEQAYRLALQQYNREDWIKKITASLRDIVVE